MHAFLNHGMKQNLSLSTGLRDGGDGANFTDCDARSGKSQQFARTSIPIKDATTRSFLLSQLVALLDNQAHADVPGVAGAGLPPELLDQLRRLTVVDLARWGSGFLGLSIQVDAIELQRELARIDRARDDRSLYESFVRRGASPRLVARLFGVSDGDVRRLRRLIAPAVVVGGRPRLPNEERRIDITAMWASLENSDLSDRRRYWQLSEAFPDVPITSLECAIGSRA